MTGSQEAVGSATWPTPLAWFERVFLGEDRGIGDSMDVVAQATYVEVAHHAGHADILREQTDGATDL